MEDFKNGMIFSTKYESKAKVFKKPHLIVFSNFMPNMEALSKDRWEIRQLSNEPGWDTQQITVHPYFMESPQTPTDQVITTAMPHMEEFEIEVDTINTSSILDTMDTKVITADNLHTEQERANKHTSAQCTGMNKPIEHHHNVTNIEWDFIENAFASDTGYTWPTYESIPHTLRCHVNRHIRERVRLHNKRANQLNNTQTFKSDHGQRKLPRSDRSLNLSFYPLGGSMRPKGAECNARPAAEEAPDARTQVDACPMQSERSDTTFQKEPPETYHSEWTNLPPHQIALPPDAYW
jgi:hypothetical protein